MAQPVLDRYGETINPKQAAENLKKYGDPRGPKIGAQADALQGQGYLQNIGERFQRGFGSEAVRKGKKEVKGLSQGIIPAIKDIPGDIADIAGSILPLGGMLAGGSAGAVAGGISGLPAGPVAAATGIAGAAAGAAGGAAAGEGARRAAGDLMGVNKRFGDATDPFGPEGQKALGDAAISGAITELGGRAIGGLVNGAKVLKPAFLKAGATLTNVGDDVLQRAFDHPQMMSDAMKAVKEHVNAPFNALANTITKRMTGIIDGAKEGFRTAADAFKTGYPDAKFDARVGFDDVAGLLKDKFNMNLLKPLKTAKVDPEGILIFEHADPGMALGPVIQKEQYNALSGIEKKQLQGVIKHITSTAPASPDELLNINNYFAQKYNKIPYGENGNPTVYHAIVTNLKKMVDEKARSAMPEEMQAAYDASSKAWELQNKFGKYFLENFGGETVSKENSQSFLMRLNSLNKGETQRRMQELSGMIGIDVPTTAQFYNDAGKLMNAFPKTGNRSLDILRTLVTTGAAAAFGHGNPAMMLATGAAGLAATSPRVVGSATMAAGRVAGSEVMKKIPALAPAMKAELYNLINEFMKEKSQPQNRGHQYDPNNPLYQ